MSAAKKGLGRGFDSLIPTDLIDDSFDPNSSYDPTASQDKKVSEQATLALSKLKANSDQPRKSFESEALQELANSIKEHGVLQPIVVTPRDDHYEIVAGERRFRASKMAGLTEVPVIVRTMTGQHQLEVSLIENIQRRDLNAVETATAYAKLRDQFNLSNDQIAGRVHKSVSAIANTLRLLKLPDVVLEKVADGLLSEGQVRPLIGLDPAVVNDVLPRIISEGWSARKIEQYVTNLKRTSGETQAPEVVEAWHEEAIEQLRSRLNTKVDIRVNAKGAGKILIGFKDAEELKRIQSLLDS